MGRHERRTRVRLPELVYRQPFEFCISFSLLVMGLGLFWGQGSMSAVVEGGTTAVLTWVWVVCVLLGAVAVIASFLLSDTAVRMGPGHVTRNRTLERAGLVLIATSALAFTTAVIAAVGVGGLYTLGVMGGVIAACVLRMISLHREDARQLANLRTVREGLDYAQGEL